MILYVYAEIPAIFIHSHCFTVIFALHTGRGHRSIRPGDDHSAESQPASAGRLCRRYVSCPCIWYFSSNCISTRLVILPYLCFYSAVCFLSVHLVYFTRLHFNPCCHVAPICAFYSPHARRLRARHSSRRQCDLFPRRGSRGRQRHAHRRARQCDGRAPEPCVHLEFRSQARWADGRAIQ